MLAHLRITELASIMEGTCLDALHGEVTVEGGPLHVPGLASILVLFQILSTHSSHCRLLVQLDCYLSAKNSKKV